MGNFLQRLAYKMQQFMYGRYGMDELGRFLNIAAIVVLVISLLPGLRFLYYPALILMVFTLYRCYSKDIAKRAKERQKFLQIKNMWDTRKTHRYFKCKSCKAVLKVPKNKGKIEITCPKCKKKIIKKT